jgi:hypothetical protein
MSVTQVSKTGPRSYTPASGTTVIGGTFVEGRAGGRIGTAAAGSLKWLGVALGDAQSPEALVTATSPAAGLNGRSTINFGQWPTITAVAYSGAEVPVKYSAAATFGDSLVITANGEVAPAGATPDARTIVGKCTEPAGVALGAVGLVRIA